MCDGHLCHISSTAHQVEIKPGAVLIFQMSYPAGLAHRDTELSEIVRILKADVIEPATSGWAPPVVFAPKKEGALRFFIDYRRLNDVMVRD